MADMSPLQAVDSLADLDLRNMQMKLKSTQQEASALQKEISHLAKQIASLHREIASDSEESLTLAINTQQTELNSLRTQLDARRCELQSAVRSLFARVQRNREGYVQVIQSLEQGKYRSKDMENALLDARERLAVVTGNETAITRESDLLQGLAVTGDLPYLQQAVSQDPVETQGWSVTAGALGVLIGLFGLAKIPF